MFCDVSIPSHNLRHTWNSGGSRCKLSWGMTESQAEAWEDDTEKRRVRWVGDEERSNKSFIWQS